jgi:hypothetical protein
MELKLRSTITSSQQVRKWLPIAEEKDGFFDVAGRYKINISKQELEDKVIKYEDPPAKPTLLQPLELSRSSLVGLYAQMNELNPMIPMEVDLAVEELQEILGMTKDDLLTLPQLNQKAGWHQMPTKEYLLDVPGLLYSADNIQNAEIIPFMDRVGRTKHFVVVGNRNGHQIVLPITHWKKDGNEKGDWLVVPPAPLFPLLGIPSLANDPSAPIVISDSILLADLFARNIPALESLPQMSCRQRFILTTWYGGLPTKADWSVLKSSYKNREIYYLLLNHSRMSKDQAMDIAAKVRDQVLANVPDIRFTIIDCLYEYTDNGMINFPNLGRIVEPGELLKGDDKPKPTEGPPLRIINRVRKEPKVQRLSDIEMVDEEEIFLFHPVVGRKSVSLLQASVDTGKRTLALSLSCFLACGAKALNKWTVPEEPNRVLYVNASIDETMLGRRLKAIANGFSEEQRQLIDNNLFLVSVEPSTLNLGTDAGQAQIEKFIAQVKKAAGVEDGAALIVFDRLASLMEMGGDSWREFSVWLNALKQDGIASLIIQDTGKADGVKELETRMPVIDNVIQIRRDGDCDGTTLFLSIQVKRGQNLSGAARRPFSVEFTPTAKSPQWRLCRANGDTSDVERGQLREKVQELVDYGASNQEIADELGMELNTFKALKPNLVKTRPYKKKNADYWTMPAAKKRQTRHSKPTTPESEPTAKEQMESATSTQQTDDDRPDAP